MKITRRDLGVILILVGILSVFLVYQMSFTKMQKEVETLQTEQKNIKKQIDELQPVKDNADFYKKEMEKFSKDIDGMISEFPVNILYEDGIMYVVELEDKLPVSIPSFTVNEATVTNSVEGQGSLAGKNYVLGKSTLYFTYTIDTYEDMKDFIDYVYADEENKRVISNVSMVFSKSTGEISGSISLNMFAMSDGTTPYESFDLPLENLGVDNIFGEVEESEEDVE